MASGPNKLDVLVPPDGAGPASETERYTEEAGVNYAPPMVYRLKSERIGVGDSAHLLPLGS
ncbi:hypothetical protein MLPF_2173 [Mycobacterium lepromatosis]|nr:hypothetical protein MLPF_0637 [Mycobacterium lepromatosis]UKN41935.1 hypothetical protein MLPF_0941 [Mycobacterium lepromatosis]UKN42604.1 hypothetical protein MLPF_2173 [Mycobacterium lepromatosis]